jgi:hypothetical protein
MQSMATRRRLDGVRKKRRLQRDATVDGLHRLLVQERYDEMLAATIAAVEQFLGEPEVRLMHGTALFWSRPRKRHGN